MTDSRIATLGMIGSAIIGVILVFIGANSAVERQSQECQELQNAETLRQMYVVNMENREELRQAMIDDRVNFSLVATAYCEKYGDIANERYCTRREPQ